MSDETSGSGSGEWVPITDLLPIDLDAKSDELPALAEVWKEERKSLHTDDSIRIFNERLLREWAIETGIIERLYTLDRGVTQLLIERGIDASLIPDEATDGPPALVATIIQDQHRGVELVFDLVSQRRSLSLSFVKELHALMTRNQETTTGQDQFGHLIQIPLEHGSFKSWPNNPTRTDGTTHIYCPPFQVQGEMERLLEMHLQHQCDGVPPEVEAAWLHHRFTQIHPFQDGNGRIARAIASLVFISADWFPLVVTRDDRTQYLDACEQADSGDLRGLIDFFAVRQKKAFVSALGIAREVTQEGLRIEQQLAAISEMFSQRDSQDRVEFEHAKDLARDMWRQGLVRLEDLARQLERSMSREGTRRTFVDSGGDDDAERRSWNRWQIVQAARELGYFAGLREFSCWVRLGIDTESGRSEMLLSLHQVGPEYRGVVGGSVTFYRRQESAEGERHAVDLQVVSDEIFQINYKESREPVSQRFSRWLDKALIRALDAWRRGE